MNRKLIASSVLAVIAGLCIYAASGPKEPVQDMNDRIIEQTAKCVASGMEAEVERRYLLAGFGDEFFVVCKTPRMSNLERLTQQMGQETQRKEKRRKVENPDGFEAKSKRTE